MKYMETESQAIERLRSEGYEADFRLNDLGRISNGEGDWAAADVTVEAVVRFEGMSDPDDEAILLALRTPGEVRGTLVLPYGPEMQPPHIEAGRAMLTAARQRHSAEKQRHTADRQRQSTRDPGGDKTPK